MKNIEHYVGDTLEEGFIVRYSKSVRLIAASVLLVIPLAAQLATSPVQAAKVSDPQFKGTIVIAIDQSGVAPEAGFKALAAAYKKVEPGVTLKWESVATAGNYVTWLGTQLAVSNPTPDIVSGNAQPGYAHYVNMAQYRYTTNPYTGQPWNNAYNWSFSPFFNSLGQEIMLRTQAVHIEWFYNKAIFRKLHLSPPKTWSQFVADSKVIKAAGVIPVAAYWPLVAQWMYEVYNYQYNFSRALIVRARPGDWDYSPQIAKGFVYSPHNVNMTHEMTLNPLRWYKAIEDGQIKFNSPKTVDLVTNLKKIFPTYAEPAFFTSDINSPETLFLQQKAAMFMWGTFGLSTLAQDIASLKHPFGWGSFQDPSMTGPLIEAPAQSVESSSGEYLSAINKNQYQTNMDVNFLQFWLHKTGYQAWVNGEVKSGQFSPAGPLLVHGVKLPPAYAKLIKAVKFQGNAENGFTSDDNIGGDPSLQTLGYLNLEKALTGAITPKAYAVNLQNLWTTHFNQILKYAGLTRQDLVDPARAPTS